MPFPDIDPVALQLGPIPIRWYALAYLTGIVLGWIYIRRMLKMPQLWGANGEVPITKTKLEDLVTWVFLGVILGGRLGYVFFYDPELLWQSWVSIADMMGAQDGFYGTIRTIFGWIHIPPALMMWKGGMSFHGGLIGVALVGWWYSRKHGLSALRVGDLVSLAAPIGLFFGRIANFINGELYGRATDLPWGMVFPTAPDTDPRHPSQLYEVFLEGFVLFWILYVLSRKFNILEKQGAAMGIFLAGYGISRFMVEFVRQPDWHMPNFPLGLTMGMFLSLPMIALGVWLYRRAHKTVTYATKK